LIVYIKYFLLMLFMVSVIGYIFAVLKEKLYLKNNIILINKKSITQEHIDEADMKEFVFDGCKVKSGDEIKVVLKGKQKLEGIVIGAKKKERAILMVTHDDKIRKLNIDNIIKFKIVSKYGKFF
jgi:hypothetical protein